jgi:hypothetical protein
MEVKFAFAHGDFVEDTLSGFQGHVIHRTKWINGCNRISVQPKAVDNKIPESYTIDQVQLKLIEPFEGKRKKKCNFKFNHGDEVKDILSGFVGRITALASVGAKNKSYYVQGRTTDPTKMGSDELFTENRLVLVKAAEEFGELVKDEEIKEPGGPSTIADKRMM